MDRARKTIVFLLLVIVVVFFSLIFLDPTPQQIGVVGEVHEHADFKVYLDGVAYNFSQEKYMSRQDNILSNFIHLHDMKGTLIHKHARGATLGLFFESLGMKFDNRCFILDDGTAYCNTDKKTLRMYVNGKINYIFEAYELHDLDRILISYGTDDEIQEQFASVPDKACIESGKCPERGLPSDEASCLTVEGCVLE
jgi:hypothetical protein